MKQLEDTISGINMELLPLIASGRELTKKEKFKRKNLEMQFKHYNDRRMDLELEMRKKAEKKPVKKPVKKAEKKPPVITKEEKKRLKVKACKLVKEGVKLWDQAVALCDYEEKDIKGMSEKQKDQFFKEREHKQDILYEKSDKLLKESDKYRMIYAPPKKRKSWEEREKIRIARFRAKKAKAEEKVEEKVTVKKIEKVEDTKYAPGLKSHRRSMDYDSKLNVKEAKERRKDVKAALDATQTPNIIERIGKHDADLKTKWYKEEIVLLDSIIKKKPKMVKAPVDKKPVAKKLKPKPRDRETVSQGRAFDKRLEYTEGKSNKFWGYVSRGDKVDVYWGPIGAAKMQKQTKEFSSVREATKWVDDKAGKKISKGYKIKKS